MGFVKDNDQWGQHLRESRTVLKRSIVSRGSGLVVVALGIETRRAREIECEQGGSAHNPLATII